MFCVNCDSVLVPKENVLVCLDCDYKEEGVDMDTFVIREEVIHTEKSRIEVVENPADMIGITKEIREDLREQYREALGNPSD
ncbi:MAG: hypothetical protein GPJ54_10615 [Candidatus Heimdallarchaeota archaeon]|nr:hypothetical protein [Candidatus Heimdallarchaeota archaeon]